MYILQQEIFIKQVTAFYLYADISNKMHKKQTKTNKSSYTKYMAHKKHIHYFFSNYKISDLNIKFYIGK